MQPNDVSPQIDSPLREFLDPDASSRRREELRRELERRITHPRTLRRSPLLGSDSSLLQQSYIISDAFEAATNGMDNPEAFQRLAEIAADSPLHPWKTAVRALLAFYRGEPERMVTLLNRLPEESPPAALARPLRRLAGTEEPPALEPAEEELIARISPDRSFIRSAAAQLHDCLAEDLEETFAETSLLLVRELAGHHYTAAQRLALWSMRTAAERGYSLSLFPGQLEQTFGSAEGMRLAALALQESDPDLALLFHLRCLLQHLRDDDLRPPALAAYFLRAAELAAGVRRMISAAEEEGEVQEYLGRLRSLTVKLEAETRKRCPPLTERLGPPPQEPAGSLHWLEENGQRLSRPYRRNEKRGDGSGAVVPRRKIPTGGGKEGNGRTARQLELF